MCLSYLVLWNLNCLRYCAHETGYRYRPANDGDPLTVTMLKKGAITLNGSALYNACVKQVESVREALERAGYDDASVEHISYAQCALLDETVMSRKPEKAKEERSRK